MARKVLRVFIILVFILAVANTLNVCEGGDVKLFSNTQINLDESRLTLYHSKNPVGVWTRDTPLDEDKHEKHIKRDENYDIWLHNVSVNDQGLYSLLYSKRTNGSRREQMNGSLDILVPPPTECSPVVNLIKEGEIYYLNATWPETDCGTPQDELIWNSSWQNTSMLRVNSTENPGLYIACMRGPAVDCAKDPSVYCSQIYINKTEGEGFYREKLDHAVDGMKQWVPIVVPIISVIALTLTAIVVVFCYCRIRKKNQRSRNNSHMEKYTGVPTHDVSEKQTGDQQLQEVAANGHVHQG